MLGIRILFSALMDITGEPRAHLPHQMYGLQQDPSYIYLRRQGDR